MVTAPERDKLSAQIAADFERRILSGALSVGDKLDGEAEIARQWRVSTRSVREAVSALEVKGLVRRRHGGRTEVVSADMGQYVGALAASVGARVLTDPDYMVKAMAVRRIMEVEVAGQLAAGAGTAAHPAIAAALDGMAAAVGTGSFAEFTEADAAFHRALVEASDNEILIFLHEKLHQLIAEVIRVASSVPRKQLADGLAEHRALFDLLNGGDAMAARQGWAAHIENSTAYLEQAQRSRAASGQNGQPREEGTHEL